MDESSSTMHPPSRLVLGIQKIPLAPSVGERGLVRDDESEPGAVRRGKSLSLDEGLDEELRLFTGSVGSSTHDDRSSIHEKGAAPDRMRPVSAEVLSRGVLLTRLSHEYCASYLDVRRRGDAVIFISEFYTGSLEEAIRLARESGGAAAVAALAGRVFACLARALSFLHSRGIVVRSLVPGMICFDCSGTIRIAHFGGYFATDGGRLCAAPLGSPAFLSPECLREGSELADFLTQCKGDLWSLAMIVLYITAPKTLTPWLHDGLSAAETAETVLSLSEDVIEEVVAAAHMPHNLRSLVLRCLDLDVWQRPEARHVEESAAFAPLFRAPPYHSTLSLYDVYCERGTPLVLRPTLRDVQTACSYLAAGDREALPAQQTALEGNCSGESTTALASRPSTGADTERAEGAADESAIDSTEESASREKPSESRAPTLRAAPPLVQLNLADNDDDGGGGGTSTAGRKHSESSDGPALELQPPSPYADVISTDGSDTDEHTLSPQSRPSIASRARTEPPLVCPSDLAAPDLVNRHLGGWPVSAAYDALGDCRGTFGSMPAILRVHSGLVRVASSAAAYEMFRKGGAPSSDQGEHAPTAQLASTDAPPDEVSLAANRAVDDRLREDHPPALFDPTIHHVDVTDAVDILTTCEAELETDVSVSTERGGGDDDLEEVWRYRVAHPVDSSSRYMLLRISILRRLVRFFPGTAHDLRVEAIRGLPKAARAEVLPLLVLHEQPVLSTSTYEAITSACALMESTAVDRQIAVDVPRCHSYHPLISSSHGRRSLSRILRTFSLVHVGEFAYFQGLDSLAAACMLYDYSNDTLAFNMLTGIVRQHLRDVFDPDTNMDALRCRVDALCAALGFVDAELFSHLHDVGFSPDLYAYPWFITLFAHVVDLDTTLMLWDTLLLGPARLVPLVAACLLTLQRERLLGADFDTCVEVAMHISPTTAREALRRGVELLTTTPATIGRYDELSDEEFSEPLRAVAYLSGPDLAALDPATLVYVDARSPTAAAGAPLAGALAMDGPGDTERVVREMADLELPHVSAIAVVCDEGDAERAAACVSALREAGCDRCAVVRGGWVTIVTYQPPAGPD